MFLSCCRSPNSERSSKMIPKSKYNPTSSKWGYPIYLCDCCPYGYHIDLDFVRYCESISRETDCTGSIKRRKDRRKQRKSMEVLLGLNSAEDFVNHVEPVSPIIEVETQILQKQDSFENVIDDFEKTLQRSKKLSNNLPDVTAVSDRRIPPMCVDSPTPTGHVEVKKSTNMKFENSNEFNLSPTTFKNIREQMALSLARTRQLEEEIKQLPQLKDQISTLKDQNRLLNQKLRMQEKLRENAINYSNFINSLDRKSRSNSFSEVNTIGTSSINIQKSLDSHSTKDIGITCSVLTRDVGVGHQTPNRINVSTETTNENTFVDKWFGEKLKFINDLSGKETTPQKASTMTKCNQTQRINNYHKTTQTILVPEKIITDKQTQTAAKSLMADFSAQISMDINVPNEKTTMKCEKCNIAKISVAVATETHDDLAPISLSSLYTLSKSVSLGDDKMDSSVRKRSLGIQYQYKPKYSTKCIQYEPSNISKSIQTDTVKLSSKSSQHVSRNIETSTQSEESSFSIPKTVTIAKKNVSCEAKERKPITQNIGCNTTWQIPSATVCSTCENRKKEEQEQKKKKENLKEEVRIEDKSSRDESLSISRIPRLQFTPTLKRQETYTKLSTSPIEEHSRLSGLDLTAKSPILTATPFEKIKENTGEISDGQDPQNEVNRPPLVRSTTYEVATTPTTSPVYHAKHRKKIVPSKEIQGALKVLNDSLQKQTKLPKQHRAIDIIQQEWFKIAGLATANPLDVEDYLDAFEDTSSLLLDYIVNMTDASGNTAMHYAVSHGNFDVVSILLDSKVCDINKPNKAGYTSVMLVSLADIRSQTHAHVVRRLFQTADVNIRAKQHGQTALMLAVSHGRLDMVKMLLEAGADINIQDDDGSTALMCAAEHGHVEIVKHFLSQPDCDSTITDVDGSTALKIAMEAEHRPIGVLLYAHERNVMAGLKYKHKNKMASTKPTSVAPVSTTQSKCLERH